MIKKTILNLPFLEIYDEVEQPRDRKGKFTDKPVKPVIFYGDLHKK